MGAIRKSYPKTLQDEILAEVVLGLKTVKQIAKKRKLPPTTIYSWLKRERIEFPNRVRMEKPKDSDIDVVVSPKGQTKTSSNNTKSSKMITSLKLERDYYKQQMEYFMGLYFKSCKK